VSGSGELIEPDDGVLAIGSGGSFALAAARALLKDTPLEPADIVEIAGDRSGDLRVHQHEHHRTRVIGHAKSTSVTTSALGARAALRRRFAAR